MIKSILDFIFEIIALEESRVWRGSGLDWTVCLDISRWAFQIAGDISLIVGKKKGVLDTEGAEVKESVGHLHVHQTHIESQGRTMRIHCCQTFERPLFRRTLEKECTVSIIR